MTLPRPLAYYSAQRIGQLRIALFGSLVVASLMLGGAVVLLATGYIEFGLAVAFPGSLLMISTLVALRTVRGPDRSAKVACVMTGALSLLVFLLFATAPVGLVPLALGVALLALSLARDSGTRRSI
jgi:hypothetical protein